MLTAIDALFIAVVVLVAILFLEAYLNKRRLKASILDVLSDDLRLKSTGIACRIFFCGSDRCLCSADFIVFVGEKVIAVMVLDRFLKKADEGLMRHCQAQGIALLSLGSLCETSGKLGIEARKKIAGLGEVGKRLGG